MATFFISMFKPPDEHETVTYRIDPDTYGEALQKRWPYSNVGRVASEHYILSWELDKETELGAPGGLFSDGKVVSFGSNPQKDAMDFVLWHRAFVPEQYPLFLFDQSLSIVFELKSDVTENELRAI